MKWATCLLLIVSAGVLFGEDSMFQRQLRGSATTPGSVAWLITNEPARADAAGAQIFSRHFTGAEGASNPAHARPLSQAMPPRLVFAPSCAACHHVSGGIPGAGTLIVDDGQTKRRTPSLAGAGVLDALGQAIGAALMQSIDADNDQTISRTEAHGEAMVATGADAQISFGRFDDADGDGWPDLDPVVQVWFVDATGQRRHGMNLHHADVVGYRLAVRAFGRAAPPHAAGGPTLRAAIVSAFALHAGLQADDPVLFGKPWDGGWADYGAAGVRQVHVGLLPDQGLHRDAAGFSRDDPDRDGVAGELASGDIDLVEWFLSRCPPPQQQSGDEQQQYGQSLFSKWSCTSCHVPSWNLGGVAVQGLYSDLRSHDLGRDFHERQGDGTRLEFFRTPPLWGVADRAPYGHDGASVDLDAVIRRHGGEALSSREHYERATSQDQAALVEFLLGLGAEKK